MHNIDDSAKTGGVYFFVARDCIKKLTHFGKKILLVSKIPKFLTFFEKISMLRSIVFETKKKPSAFFMTCRLSILSALAELDKKSSLVEKFFSANYLSGIWVPKIWKPKENLLAIKLKQLNIVRFLID